MWRRNWLPRDISFKNCITKSCQFHKNKSNTFSKLLLLKWLFLWLRMLVYRWTKATSQKLECLRVGSDSLHLQFELTIWALSWPRKHINCTPRFKNVIFRHHSVIQKNSSYIETEQCYLFRVTHFNHQNLMLITPPNDQAIAYGTYWKYLAEH